MAIKLTEDKFAFGQFNKKHLQLLNIWKPGSPYNKCRYIVVDGAVRAGKTVTMTTAFLQWSLQFQGKKFALIGKTIQTLERNVSDNFVKIANYFNLPISKHSQPYLHYKIGTNEYLLYEANNKASQDKIQGITLQGSLLDEVALFPDNLVKQCFVRHSESGAKIWLNCNPDHPKAFIKSEVIDTYGDNMWYESYYLEDNLNLDQEVIDSIKSSFSGVFYERNILGKWVAAEGLIYDMFNKNYHVVKTEDRDYTEYYVASDFGTQNAQVFLLFGKCKGKWYLIKEYYYSGRDEKKQKTPDDYVEEYIKWIGDIKPKKIIIDPSATPLKAAFKKFGINNIKNAKNPVIEGIMEVQNALRDGIIFINDCCIRSIEEIQLYQWDDKKTENGKDVPLAINDHAMDAFRYFIYTQLSNGIRKLEAIKYK